MSEYYIGQIITGDYPVDLIEWCNLNNATLIELEKSDNIRRFQIVEPPKMTPEEKEAEFEREFFNTSIGWIRRSVTMADGSRKDFLSDLLPIIAIGFNMGQQVSILTYQKPDFSNPFSDWSQYQSEENVTERFIQECFERLQNDFLIKNGEE